MAKGYYLFENGTFTEQKKSPTQSWKSYFGEMIEHESQMMSQAFEQFAIDQDDEFEPQADPFAYKYL